MSQPLPSPARPAASPQPGPLSEEDCARLRAQLARAVARVCPPWLSAQSEDIVQAALIRVVEILRRREGDASLNSSYLWKVAYSATVDEIRRRRRRKEVPLEEGEPGGVENLKATLPDPERLRESQEVGNAIRECLARLLRERRLAVTLYLQAHSVPELSRLLGWSTKRGENLVYRGLADLRACLSSKGVRP